MSIVQRTITCHAEALAKAGGQRPKRRHRIAISFWIRSRMHAYIRYRQTNQTFLRRWGPSSMSS